MNMQHPFLFLALAWLAVVAGCSSGGTEEAAPAEPNPVGGGDPALVFLTAPANAIVGNTFSSDIVVAMDDGSGGIDPAFADDVALSIESNPGGGTLLGTTSRTAAAGEATFPGLAIDLVGSGYRLRATSGSYSVVSDPFDITAPPVTTNGTTAGNVTTETTFVAAAINWTLTGDDNEDATCAVRYRRTGTTLWKEALSLSRIVYSASARNGEKRNLNKFSGSIVHLSPGTAYDVELTISDPDGGGTSRQVSLTTRSMPRMPSGGNVVEVRTTDDLSTVQNNAQPPTPSPWTCCPTRGRREHHLRYGYHGRAALRAPHPGLPRRLPKNIRPRAARVLPSRPRPRRAHLSHCHDRLLGPDRDRPSPKRRQATPGTTT